MVRAVIDANVWVSTAMFPYSTPGQVVELVREGAIQSISSEALVGQVGRALVRVGFRPDAINVSIVEMRSLSLLVEPVERLAVITAKESDNRVLESAVAGDAHLIVTGDRRHLLPLGQYQDIPILSPREALEWLRTAPGNGLSSV